MFSDFQRIKRLPPYVFNIVNELKAQARARGEDIVDFGMGNPDQPTPQHIIDKLVEASQRKDTHRYSVSRGIPRLRRAICHWYQERFQVDLDHDSEAIVTIGSKEGLAHLALATLGTGDTVLVPNPAYPIHPYGFVISGADIRHVPLIPGVDFFQELEKSIKNTWPKPKMLVLNFPGNPTTQCVELDFFQKVVEVAREHEIWVVHDLAYADIVFDGYKAPSILQVPGAKDVAVEFFTLSKSYNMPGWRVGFMCGNPTLVGALARMKSYLDYGMFTPIQVAAITALEGLPIHVVKELNAYLRAARHFAQTQDHEPTPEEIARYLDKPIDDVKRILGLNERVTSVDTPLSKDSEKSILDAIPDENNGDPALLLQDEDFNRHLELWLSQLNDKQKRVVEGRFGLNGHKMSTLEEVGNDIGVTRERVRQIQVEALSKLRDIMEREGFSAEAVFN